ncbi:hypothetical protein SAMD00019534_077960 [Acytostelium subglobosum LB1]|uniref:hypothetical protein n=1 Tax=Acytostelium subglobosum LB1 TaxID=1410327 RepID=UPI000644828B|nr:hypothetical protein SAMD00019534_077960 [Acytostelium subglobosum LB1]GAM24621.1 hypothetical protein SAMD00019534_077960 [Acytostelium subglobosum LB1]|eukprot:XP_012752290.1 hypothetical protein SAMD00019534_077960 [Acytostelium subglobosum LB1]
MDDHEQDDSSRQVLALIHQLSDARAKKVLIAFCQDLVNFEKTTPSHSSSQSSTTSQTSTTQQQTTPTITQLLDLCYSHSKRSLTSSQPSLLWKILEYSIVELDHLEQQLDEYKTNKQLQDDQKLITLATSRLDEISSLINYLNNQQQQGNTSNSNEYNELMATVGAHMKRLSLRIRDVVGNNQYSEVVKYGWIEKRCGNNQSFRTWKKMWFILKSSAELQYYIKDKGLSKKMLISTCSSNSLVSPVKINMEGELGKKKEGKGWKVRWMKLLDTTLEYYRTQKEKEPLGIINLNECQWCDVYKDMSNKFVINLSTGKFYFQAVSKEDLHKWVSAIKSRIPAKQTNHKMDLAQFSLKGIIYLSNIVSIQECSKFTTQPNCVLIATDKKHFYLSFDTGREKCDWLLSINEQLAKRPSQLTSSKSLGLMSVVVKSNANSGSSSNGNGNTNGNGNGNGNGNMSGSGTIRKWEVGQILPSQKMLGEDIRNSTSEDDQEFGSQILKKRIACSRTSSAATLPVSAPGRKSSHPSAMNIAHQLQQQHQQFQSMPVMINGAQEDSDDADESGAEEDEIPHYLRSEIMKRSAHNLLKSFKVEVFLPSLPENQETYTFLFSDHVLVDQVKSYIFKKIAALQSLPLVEYRLGVDEDNILEIEFLKFIYSNTIIELSLNTCGIVKIGVYHNRKDRRIKEKLYPDKFNAILIETKIQSTRNSVDMSQRGDLSMDSTPSSRRMDGAMLITPNSISTKSPINEMDDQSATSESLPHSQSASTLAHLRRVSTVPSPTFAKKPILQQCAGWSIQPLSSSAEPNNVLKLDKQQSSFYRKCFADGESVHSFLGEDAKVGPIAFSLVKNAMRDRHSGILHTKFGVRVASVDGKSINFGKLSLSKKLKKRKIISHLVNTIDASIDAKHLSLATNQSEFQKELLSLEERQTTSGFKFGLVLCKDGQLIDDDIFSNQTGNKEYEDFLDLLGNRIELMGWTRYSAGLDVRNNTTGTHSLYTEFKGNEVMFHVSTLLPYTQGDPQQIERKRQIGNDICVIIFNEGSHSYVPSTITSQFNHIVIVVQYDRLCNTYKVGVSTKDGVETFGPPIPQSIKKDHLRDFLLTKLINGELASLQAPVFANKITRTRETLLKYFIEQYS